jgi:L-alanine-DL-glutamate epimerase-like enolase superfamily enzyme
MENSIKTIKLTPVHVPFKKFVKNAMESSEGGQGMVIPTEEPWQGGDSIICQLIDNEGNVGLGDMMVWLPETGVSTAQVIDSIKDELYKYILGETPFNIEQIRSRMDNNVSRNEVAKGLLDMACYDLMGQITGRPAHDFMGGKCVEEIQLAALLHLMDAKSMAMLARSYYRSGYRTIRYKLGRSIEEDVEITAAIREKLGNKVRLRVDYNQAYKPTEAVRAIKAIEPYGIDTVEQPVHKNDFIGLAYVQKRVNTPIMTHEGTFSVQDYMALVEMGAIEVLGLNAERPGGVINLLKLINYAELRGLGVVLHSQPFGIASAMHAHVAAAKYYTLGHDPELFGNVMMEHDLLEEPLNYDNGKLKVPNGPGWGVKLNENALEKYSTSPTVIIE